MEYPEVDYFDDTDLIESMQVFMHKQHAQLL